MPDQLVFRFSAHGDQREGRRERAEGGKEGFPPAQLCK